MGDEFALSPKSLTAFLTIAECGGVRHAAERLRMSQPAVSRIIQRLELQLQADLFERMPTGMVLTAYGKALLPYAQALRREGQHAFEHIDALRGLRRGTVRIGSIASAAVGYLPHIVRQVANRHPHFRYEIIETTDDQLAEELLNLEIDLAIFGARPGSGGLVEIATQTMGDNYSALAAADHPLFSGDPVIFEDLRSCDWVMPRPGAIPRDEFEAALDAAQLDSPNITVETRSVSAIKGLIVRGGFVGWLPLPIVATEIAAGIMRPIPFAPLQLTRTFHCYRSPAQLVSPTATEFIQILSTCDFTQLRTKLIGYGLAA